MKLYICEKPSQARDIAEVLGSPQKNRDHIQTNDGIVTWAIGHLLEQATPEEYSEVYKKWDIETLPIIPEEFLVYPKNQTLDQCKAIGKLLQDANEVVISTDADREGEMIARELLEYHKYEGRITRLWLSALDPESIKKALSKVKSDEETVHLYHAALARSRSDWLVGMNLTRGMTSKFSTSGVFSIGRVQTPTLALVVRRDREIEGFKSRDYFELEAQVLSKGGSAFKMFHAPKEENRIFDKVRAEKLAKDCTGKNGILKIESEEKEKEPPKLFNLSGLQKRCSALWGWSADKTLSVAQSLYEEYKATTYPRSDCVYLPEEQISDAKTIVFNLLQIQNFSKITIEEPIIRNSVFNTKKVTAHHAIIPTLQETNIAAMNEDAKKAFVLIASHYLASLLPNYVYQSTKVFLPIQLENESVEFCVSGTTPTKDGWKIVFSKENEEEEEDLESKNIIPKNLQNGEDATAQKVSVVGKKTQPPKRYTEGTLIGDMENIAKYVQDPEKKKRLRENSGIGTEATRASIIKGLREKEFLLTDKKNIISSQRARSLVEALEKHLPTLVDPGETAVWEEGLEKVASGAQSHETFVDEISELVRTHIDTIRTNVTKNIRELEVKCPISKEAIQDHGQFYLFPGILNFRFKKIFFDRAMLPMDWVKVLSNSEGHFFDGFKSNGKKWGARLKFNAHKEWEKDGVKQSGPGIDLIFDKKPTGGSSLKSAVGQRPTLKTNHFPNALRSPYKR